MSLYTQTLLNYVPPSPNKTALETRLKAVQDGNLETTQMPELTVERSATAPIAESQEPSVLNLQLPESETP